MGVSEFLLYSLPKKELPEILCQLKTYEQGKNDNLILELNAFIRSHRTSREETLEIEQQLISFLKTDATTSAKMEVCRHLRIIGSKESVSVLENMLLKKETTDMARYALEKIPGPESRDALLKTLNKTSGLIKAGIVSSIGHRKIPEAVPRLKKLLHENSDSSLSFAAAAALGHIKNSEAYKILLEAFSKTSGELKIQISGSLLKCAEEYLSKGNKGKAQNIYHQILSADLPPSLHHSAIRGKIRASHKKAPQLIVEALKNNKNIHSPYIEMIPKYFDGSHIEIITDLLPSLPTPAKIQLITVFSLYPEQKVLQAVLRSAESSSQEARIASLKTLKQIGDPSTVGFLAQYAASTKGKEQQEARSSLWGLQGKDINKTIISNLEAEKMPEIQREYIGAVEERRIYSGKNIIFKKLNSDNPKIRIQSIRTLKTITSPEDMPKLIDFLLSAENSRDRKEMINTIAFTALKIKNPLVRGEIVEKTLADVHDPISRSSLYLILGRIGDDSTLSLLRKGIREPNEMIQDSVVRAFANWPTPTAADDVHHIAKTSDKPEHQILCTRAYIRMVEMEPFRRPEAAVRSLETALNLSPGVSEKIMILGVLPKFPCKRAAYLAYRLMENKDIEQEAQNAFNLITEKIKKEKEDKA